MRKWKPVRQTHRVLMQLRGNGDWLIRICNNKYLIQAKGYYRPL